MLNPRMWICHRLKNNYILNVVLTLGMLTIYGYSITAKNNAAIFQEEWIPVTCIRLEISSRLRSYIFSISVVHVI